MKSTKTIAFQGRPGAYSEQAIQEFFPEATPLACDHFEDILQAVAIEAADYAMLPVENTLGGTVIPACQALFASELAPIREYVLPIHHLLIAPPGVGTIKIALSHPQALAQCQNYLKQHHIQAESFYDTAGAAEALAKAPRQNTAAIASRAAAAHYGLDILDTKIEDEAFNQTRFLLIGKMPQVFEKSATYKTSLRFTLANTPNSLAKVLHLFGSAGLNLSKIESHPTRKAAWEYSFFLDVMAHTQDLEPLLPNLRLLTHELQCLNSYLSSSQSLAK
jgi:prephenate dehydratase